MPLCVIYILPDAKDKCFMTKELWRIGHAKGLGETKPIPARTARAKGRQGCRCHRRDPSCETKPICPAPTGKGRGGWDRRRLSRWGQTCETKPISRIGPTERVWNRQLQAPSTSLRAGPARQSATVCRSLSMDRFRLFRLVDRFPRGKMEKLGHVVCHSLRG